MATATPTKTCIKCGQDCSGKPRTKDAHGRYTCRACYDKVLAAAKSVEVKAPRAAAAVAGPAAGGAQPEAPEAGGMMGTEEPLDAGAFLGDAIPLEADGLGDVAVAQPKECANCGMFLPSTTIVCTRCGLNTQTGKVLGTQKLAGEGRQCIKCGYALQGLKSAKCPECGTVNAVKTKANLRREQDRADSKKIVRNAYLQPIIVFAIGLTISVVVAADTGPGGAQAIVAYLVQYAIFVPIGVVAFFLCCLLWMGFDAPMHLTAIRLAAVYAGTDAVRALMGSLVLVPYVSIAVMLGTYIGLLMWVCDLDRTEAALVAVMTLVLRVAVGIALLAILINAGVIQAP